ncbi:MAG: hypothetical protein ACK4YP_20535 [Myxococcota bacterium]
MADESKELRAALVELLAWQVDAHEKALRLAEAMRQDPGDAAALRGSALLPPGKSLAEVSARLTERRDRLRELLAEALAPEETDGRDEDTSA